jgi:RHS repeat-associated protein
LYSDNIYDYKNRLFGYRYYNLSGTATDVADYVNDPLDRPVQVTETHAGTTTTTSLTYVGLSNAVGTETLTGGVATTKTYAYDPLGRRVTLSNGTERYSYLNDPYGSVSLLVDQSRAVKESYGYSGYGSANSSLTKSAAGFNPANAPFKNLYRFSSKRWDSGSGSYDMGARRYSASTGRFLQRDQYDGALDNLGLASDPLTGSRYALAAGNPVSFIELDGHEPAIPCASGGYDRGSGCHAVRDTSPPKPDSGGGAPPKGNNGSGNGGSGAGGSGNGGSGNGGGGGGGGFGPEPQQRCSSKTAHSWSLDALTWDCFKRAIMDDRERLGRFTEEHPILAQILLSRGGGKGGRGPVMKGQAGVARAVYQIESRGGSVIGREVTVSTTAGRTRVDLVYRDYRGNLHFMEVKNGPTAVLNKNQETVHNEFARSGGTLRGANAENAGFKSGTHLGPTSIIVQRYK